LENGTKWQRECIRQGKEYHLFVLTLDFVAYYHKIAENEYKEFEKARNSFYYHRDIQNDLKLKNTMQQC
jgi:hypothetical protein